MSRLLPLLCLLLVCGCSVKSDHPPIEGAPPAPLSTTSTAGDTSFLKADAPRDFSFPLDHSAHPAYQTEWWYYTGTLRTEAGRAFGVQVTFFRRALTPDQHERSSVWATRDICMAHFCISDFQEQRFHQAERMARSAAGLARTGNGTPMLTLLGWTIDMTHDTALFTLSAPESGIGVQLTGQNPAEVVLHDDSPGWSFKGGPAQASYYYSYPRLPVRGTLEVDDEAFAVAGDLWMDHEFGSNQLNADQQGWDWFALQLADGSAAMLFRIRPTDPAGTTVLSGTWIAPDGTVTPLHAADIVLTPGTIWRSPQSRTDYPIAWDIAVPSVGLDVTVAAKMPNQELHTTKSTGITYWEGAISVAGSHSGEGYLEMTGYVENVGGRF